jgi:hypothetical protein
MAFILLIPLIVFAVLFFQQKSKNSKQLLQILQLNSSSRIEREDFQRKSDNLQKRITELQIQVQELSMYQGILDANKQVSDLLAFAQLEAGNLIVTAQLWMDEAKQESSVIRKEAREQAKLLKEKSQEILASATSEAGKIIIVANERAKEIAGDAYDALKNVEHLEQAAKAMRNVIEGYGDNYLVPSYILIDALADEFGHLEAGVELKKARERTRLMVQNKTAAQCEYVETNRKDTAVNFVTDAFNGKVDSILAAVKHDNFGTLEQKIKDAYYLVNNLGKAFRNAKINQEYLNNRLEELKWSCTAYELKLKEREEQRLIKEQIREEEKAKRDFERAIKDAQKEEDLLKKAIEKVQREMGMVSFDDRAKYEDKLNELNERLLVAEEKNQRALSMAQQTRTGHVYIISNIGSFGDDVYKIGMTRRLEPIDRVRELGDASVPFEFDVHSFIFSEDAPALERELHKKFLRKQINKVNPRKEFFKVSLKDIRDEIESLGLNVRWTMVAEARQYRESLSLEKAIKENSLIEADWERNQLEEMPIGIEEEEIN